MVHKKQWQNEDINHLLEYNAKDSAATARVDKCVVNEPDWDSDRVQKLYTIHTELSKKAARMHTIGFAVDEDRRRSMAKTLTMLHTRRMNELIAHVGPRRSPQFKGTPDSMRALIYERHAEPGIRSYGLPDPDAWDAEMWTNENCNMCACDKAALLRVLIAPSTPKGLKEDIQLYWRAHAPKKAKSTWVDSESVRDSIMDDGRAHTDWNSCGTETMRWSGPLMTLPKGRDDDALQGRLPNMRSMYCAGRGKVLVNADWSQQELRVKRAIAADDILSQALSTGDVYSNDARFVFKLPDNYDVKANKPTARHQCKSGHLAFQYGAMTPAMWTQMLVQDLSVTYAFTDVVRKKLTERYWRTAQYWQEEHARVRACGYSEGRLLFGRRHYPAEPPITETANYPIQRTAGELAAISMLSIDTALHDELVGADIVAILHDAFTVECLEKDAYTVASILTECMEGPWTIDGITQRFPVDVKFGHYWSELG